MSFHSVQELSPVCRLTMLILFAALLANHSSILLPYIKSPLPIVLFKSGCVFRHRRFYVTWNFIYCDIYRQHSIQISISTIVCSHCILWFPRAIVTHYATLLQSPPPSPLQPTLPSSVYVHLTCHDGLLWPRLVLQNRPNTGIQVDTPKPAVAPEHRRSLPSSQKQTIAHFLKLLVKH